MLTHDQRARADRALQLAITLSLLGLCSCSGSAKGPTPSAGSGETENSSGGMTDPGDTGPAQGGAPLGGSVQGLAQNQGAQSPGPNGAAAGGSAPEQTTPGSGASAEAEALGGNQAAGAGAGGASPAGLPSEPYANVTAVSVTGSSGSYVFSVTIESTDRDCTHFANWWEVLTASGELVFRRILEHSHTDENGTTDPDAPGNTFTREGGPVNVTDDAELVVRAHLNDTGYAGLAMRGTPDAGFTPAPEIGPEFAGSVEQLEPQPSTCLF